MSPAHDTLQAHIAAAARLVRRRATFALAVLAAASLPLALAVAWLLGVRWLRPTPVPLVLDAIVLAAGAAVLFYWRRRVRPRLDELHVAAAAERRLGLTAGSIRGALELGRAVPEGTSRALAQRSERVLHGRVATHRSAELAGDLGDGWLRRARAWGGALALCLFALATLGFLTPERSRAGWTPLLHPVRQLLPPELPPLEVAPGDAQVQRGDPLAVRVRAAGRDAVTLRWRVAGDVERTLTLPVRGDSASGEIERIDAAGEYWVEAPDGAASARYRITPIDALLLSELTVDVLYPSYLALPPDHFEGELPPLELPAGSTLRLSGRATRELESAALLGARGAVPFRVRAQGFEGSWMPAESGLYAWQLHDRAGSGLAIAPAPVEILLVADQPPSVELTYPGVDTILAPDLRQALAAEARDDHGLAGAVLVSWRIPAAGSAQPAVETPLPIDAGGERVVLRTVLDAAARGLVPGDTLKYFVRVVDGSPARQSAVSRTYSLRLPSPEELRARAAADARTAVEQAEAMSRRAAELERQARNAERNTQAGNARRASGAAQAGDPGREGAQKLQFAETQEARRVLEQQQQMLQQAEQLQAAMRALEKSMTEAGLRDQELQRRLEEMRELMDRLVTPEMRRQMEQLQKALQELDPQQLEKALERLSQQQEAMKEQLERSLEMLKRAEAEQEMNALAQQARELATQQDALAKAHEEQKTPEQARERARQQEELAGKGEELHEELEQLQQELGKQGEQNAAQQAAAAARQAEGASEQMQQAAASAAQQQGQQAGEQGRKAAEQLEKAAEQLESARRQMSEDGRQQAQESMQQATRDALSLAQRQQELQQRMEQGGQEQAQQQQQQQQQQGGEKGQQAQQAPGQRQNQQGNQQGGQKAQQSGGDQKGGQQQGGGSGGQQPGGRQGAPTPQDLAQMRAEQAALQQGLEQLGRNLQETGQRAGVVNQDVGASLNRANTAMQQTQQGLQQAQQTGQLPAEQAGQSVEALNRLALSLLNNAQQMQQEGGGGAQQAMQQLADAARQQGSVNGQSNSLQPLGVSQSASADQVRRLGREQQEIASKLSGMNDMLGSREDVLGEVDALAKEAAALARELQGGRLPPEVLARQERLFHRLLDAGRSLEQEETSDERTAEKPGAAAASDAPRTLDPRLLQDGTRFRVPGAEELRALPPAYRRLILDYFERLNRPAPPAGGGK